MDRESSPEEGEIVVAPPEVPIKAASKAEEAKPEPRSKPDPPSQPSTSGRSHPEPRSERQRERHREAPNRRSSPKERRHEQGSRDRSRRQEPPQQRQRDRSRGESGAGRERRHPTRPPAKDKQPSGGVGREGGSAQDPLRQPKALDFIRAKVNALADQISEQTKSLGVADAKRDTKKHCETLEEAVKNLVKLSIMHQNEDEPLGDAKLTIPALAKKVFAGLRVLHVVCNTGAGGKLPWGREAAIRAVQLANKHMAMFPENNQTEFRGWCKGKKVFAGLLAGEGTPSASAPTVKPKQQNVPVPASQTTVDPPRPPPGQPPAASVPTMNGSSIPGPAPPSYPKPAPPPGSPPTNGQPHLGSSGIPLPRPPPGSPSSSQQNGTEAGDRKRKRGTEHTAVRNGGVGLGLQPVGQPWEDLGSGGESSVPGLDQDFSAPGKAQKKARTTLEETISLEDELELYSYGPNTAAIAAVSQGVDKLAADLIAEAAIPGIDAPVQDRHKQARLLASAEKASRDAQQQNAEFDEEADRLFGGSSSEDEKEGASDMEVEAQQVEQEGKPEQTPAVQESLPALEQAVGGIPAQEQMPNIHIPLPQTPPKEAEPPSQPVLDHLGEGKLCLVLDLDYTLLNSVRWGEVDPQFATKLEDNLEREEAAVPPAHRQLHSLEAIQMWTKLRPGCREFLRALSGKYIMWIHTNGNRHYAAAVCSILDPTGELFGERVVANAGMSTTEGATAASLIKRLDAKGLEGLEPITVIVDDTATVWPGHASNLVTVERYCYFPNSTKQFGYKRRSLLEDNRDERRDEGMLSVVQRLLLQTHTEVMSRFRGHSTEGQTQQLPAWDVRLVLTYLRTKVLAGTKVIFSRLWRNDIRPQDHPLWILATRLGAVCTTTLDEGVTHLITDTMATEKAQWALQKDKAIVSVRWLEGSAIMWQRAHEALHPVPR